MKKRLFVGIFLSKDLQAIIGEWKKEHNHFSVRYVPLENLHITLVPPWYEEDSGKVVALLQNAKYQVKPFFIKFYTIEQGPDTKSPRLIWAKGKINEEFMNLKSQIARVLRIKEENRKHILHTTLARFKHNEKIKIVSEKINWQQKVTTFSLIESHLKKSGVVYEVIANISI